MKLSFTNKQKTLKHSKPFVSLLFSYDLIRLFTLFKKLTFYYFLLLLFCKVDEN
jgi:hypothetical protein